jgi:hypothetical protein
VIRYWVPAQHGAVLAGRGSGICPLPDFFGKESKLENVKTIIRNLKYLKICILFFISEDGNTQSFRNVVFCSEYDAMGKEQNSVTLTVPCLFLLHS